MYIKSAWAMADQCVQAQLSASVVESTPHALQEDTSLPATGALISEHLPPLEHPTKQYLNHFLNPA